MSYKILLADDSVTVQKIITLTFSDEGVDVMPVNNGDEAIQHLQYMRPALVMADVSIPGKNGYEICEYVKSHPEMKNTPVILLVPAFEPFDEERARRLGADYHLTKPFQSIRTLISTVKNLIEPEAPLSSPPPVPQEENLAAASVDPKSAKIEELIRKSNIAAVDREEELLSEIGSEKSGFVQAAMSANQPNDASHKYEPSPLMVSDNQIVKMPNESLSLDEYVAGNEFDDILELDDVMPEVAAQHELMIAEGHSEIEPEEVTISPGVVDEIVNRVVSKLTSQLAERLVEKLAGELSSRIAPEVAEIIRSQQFSEPRTRRGIDNLLEID